MSFYTRLRNMFCRVFKCAPTQTPAPTPVPTNTNVSVTEGVSANAITGVSASVLGNLVFVGTASDKLSNVVSDSVYLSDSASASDTLTGGSVPGVTYLAAVLPANLQLVSYKNLSASTLRGLATLVYSQHPSNILKTHYEVDTTGDTFLNELLANEFTDYLFGLIPAADGVRQYLQFGAGFTVNSDGSVDIFHDAFCTSTPDLNIYFWALIKDMVSKLPASSKKSTTVIRFTFNPISVELLAWFQKKAQEGVPVGVKYPDVLRSFLLKGMKGPVYETTATYSMMLAYSQLTKVPEFSGS